MLFADFYDVGSDEDVVEMVCVLIDVKLDSDVG